jgi:hypothetical protein
MTNYFFLLKFSYDFADTAYGRRGAETLKLMGSGWQQQDISTEHR